jgi:GRIP domain
VKILVLEKQVEETKNRESQTRQANKVCTLPVMSVAWSDNMSLCCKTLREELRKVQSSAALLERQRNPGVGYWTTRKSESSTPSDPRMSISTPTDSPSRVSSPIPSTDTKQNEEEVNLEYLRNVILQFLEHKEMRVSFPSLIQLH